MYPIDAIKVRDSCAKALHAVRARAPVLTAA